MKSTQYFYEIHINIFRENIATQYNILSPHKKHMIATQETYIIATQKHIIKFTKDYIEKSQQNIKK